MFRYKRTVFRERNMGRLKPTANDKPIFTGFHSLLLAPLLYLLYTTDTNNNLSLVNFNWQKSEASSCIMK
jgi:hypothetical protein